MTNIDIDESFEAEPEAAPKRGRGRPPKNAVREPMRSNNRGGAVVLGRDGQPLSRSVTEDRGDQFYVDPAEVPAGWTYQWNTVHIYNNPEVVLRIQNRMYANGWRPVPAERYPGRWTPLGHKGDIVVEGMRLEERPAILTQEAREQDQRKARQQMIDRDQALMGGRANFRGNASGQGIPVRGTGDSRGTAIRMSIDPALDAPAPSYEPADDGAA